ncbi:MAG: cytochrome P450 [Actinobacteria bacterium]|nr:cytochrome P450 [Actinomycetota bacterium]
MEINDQRGRIFVSPQAYADQEGWHEVAAELRRDDPVLRVEAEGYTPFFALTRHADVFEVSRRSDIFFNTRNAVLGPDANFELIRSMGIDPKTLIHMDGVEHRDHRHVTNDWFKPAAVKRRQEDIEAIADEFADKLVDFGGSCDFAQDIAVPYTLRVIMSIFGVPQADERLMLELTQGIFGAADPEYLGDVGDPLTYLTRTVARFDEYFAALTEDRRAHPTDDLATVIANGQIDGCPMERHAQLWYYIIVATAGHDTTSYALAGGMEALLRQPDQLAALAVDPALATNAAEEMIRWTAPVRAFLRYAQEDTEIAGVPIAAGERVLLSYPSANRDDAVFTDPMRFDITRPDADKLISFGLGVHYCLGSQFARREVRTMLPKLLERVSAIELAGDPQWAEANFVGGVKHLPVTYTLR